MTLDEVKKQFVEQVKLRGYDDQYIDRKEEREILQIALQNGVGVDSARNALSMACVSLGFVQESEVMRLLKDVMDVFSGNDGQIDEDEFNNAVLIAKKWTKGKKNDVACKRMLCEIIDEAASKTSSGWFSSWYGRVKKEIGM